MAHLYPDRSIMENFRVPLTPGEWSLVEALVQTLDDSYEVFVQPFLDGDRPDVVVMRRGSGQRVKEALAQAAEAH